MTADRMRRVDEAMREVLSEAITSELKDPRVGFVTVTAVDTAPDLRQARVFVSVLGTGSERRRSLDGLRSAHGYLQRRVADQLHLRHTPMLEFVYDNTAERAQRIESLLKREGPE
jgi:ribosome-binding factor A